MQVTLLILYLKSKISASAFSIECAVLNFIFATLVIILMLVIAFWFSGSPVRSDSYRFRIRKMGYALVFWTLTRFLRGVWGLFDNEFYYGLLNGLSKMKSSDLFVPMILIGLFVVIEVLPFLFVLDWGFMEMFVEKNRNSFYLSDHPIQESLYSNASYSRVIGL